MFILMKYFCTWCSRKFQYERAMLKKCCDNNYHWLNSNGSKDGGVKKENGWWHWDIES